jgi:hypothetical protein
MWTKMTKMRKPQRDLHAPDRAPGQVDLIQRLRAESCLSKSVPLAYSAAFLVERGPTSDAWFRQKHSAGQFGRFYPLHQTARPQ